jgi:hypothetical protein
MRPKTEILPDAAAAVVENHHLHYRKSTNVIVFYINLVKNMFVRLVSIHGTVDH